MFFQFNDLDEITDNLYLGNLASAENIEELKKKGIKKVLSVLDSFAWPKYKESDNINHKAISISDLENQNIIQYFGECLNFIKGNDKILVHCAVGASRSASIVIAYIMWTKKMLYKEAFEFVHKKRNIICPNFGFVDQLHLFEKELIEKNYDIDKIKFEEIKWEPKQYYDYLFN